MRSLEDSLLRKNWRQYLAYRERKIIGVQSGIPALDNYLLGLGGLVLIQGGTGSCKSSLSLQILHHNLRLGYPSIVIDRENGAGRMWDRLLCQANGVSSTDLAVAFAEDKEKLKTWMRKIVDLPLHLYTEPVRTQEVVRERVEELLAKDTTKPALLLVDSLQAMDSVDSDQRINLEKWLVFLDQLKLQGDGRLTIIVTSEINRASYNDSVGVGSGKGTNGIDFKSETLLDMRENVESGLIQLTVGKHRDGLKGARFNLEKVLADVSNPMSFTFQLRCTEDLIL